MLKEGNVKQFLFECNYYYECKVEDTETKEVFYCILKESDLALKTYKSSYTDFLSGITTEEPVLVEGEDGLWFDIVTNRGETCFFDVYQVLLEYCRNNHHYNYLDEKYKNIKKPSGKIKYQILNKREQGVFACGPMGNIYEIEFLLEDNRHLFVFADDVFSGFILDDVSIFDEVIKNEEAECRFHIEETEDFDDATYSDYYDLYFEMEKYRDGYDQ